MEINHTHYLTYWLHGCNLHRKFQYVKYTPLEYNHYTLCIQFIWWTSEQSVIITDYTPAFLTVLPLAYTLNTK